MVTQATGAGDQMSTRPDSEVPSLEELFVVSVQHAVEAGRLLGLSCKDFTALLKTAWKTVDRDMKKEEK